MRLTYIYHSGFAIEADEFAILILIIIKTQGGHRKKVSCMRNY